MPNICSYEMRVIGPRANVKKLIDWANAEYDYSDEANPQVWIEDEDGNKLPVEHHIGYRVFDCTIGGNEEDIEDLDEDNANDVIMVDTYGDCAWSIKTCMLNNGQGCYMSDKAYQKPNSKAISINDACKELKLDVEIFSTEPGMEFGEHYIFNSEGEFECEDVFDYYSYCIEDYKTYDDFCKDNDCPLITKQIFDEAKENDEICIDVGDIEKDEYGEWPFELYL